MRPALRALGGAARLADVDVPREVELIGEVQLDAGQLVVFLLDESQPEPVPGDEEPPVSVDIKALLVRPFAGAGPLTVGLRGSSC